MAQSTIGNINAVPSRQNVRHQTFPEPPPVTQCTALGMSRAQESSRVMSLLQMGGLYHVAGNVAGRTIDFLDDHDWTWAWYRTNGSGNADILT